MLQKHRIPVALATVVCAGLGFGHALAGDLNPPGGPIAATDRVVLNAQAIDLPYTISNSGSYVLTSDLTGVAGENGLIIDADNVTLDLNGFSVVGVAGSLDGIRVAAAHTNLAVFNGTVRGWGDSGVDAVNASNSLFASLRVTDNLGGPGLETGVGCIVTDCASLGNSGFFGHGISVRAGSVISGCTSEGNGGAGFQLRHVNAADNFAGGVISRCTARQNVAQGIEAAFGGGCVIADCTANGSTEESGIVGPLGSVIIDCTANSNFRRGIEGSNGNTVVDCTADGNGDSGVFATFGTSVSGCTSRNNSGHGIEVGGIGGTGCRIAANTCDSNGGGAGLSGVFVGGGAGKNRIEANTVTDNSFGIKVQSAGNIIIWNSASGNTGAGVFPEPHYVIVAGNSIGDILDASGVDITTTNPWRNFGF